MSDAFFSHPILNSPYDYPAKHWELEPGTHQPTGNVVEFRRKAEFITPIPQPKKQKASPQQAAMVFDEGKGLSTARQQYDPTPIINELRQHVDRWREIPNPASWGVTPETQRLLQHWRPTTSPASAPSSARSRPSRPPSGSPKSPPQCRPARASSSTSPAPTTTPTLS